jgi:hypothetical protein
MTRLGLFSLFLCGCYDFAAFGKCYQSNTPGCCVPGALGQDNFQRPNQAEWGTASDGQAWGSEAAANPAFSIHGNTGQVAPSSGPLNAILGSVAPDAEVFFSGQANGYTTDNIGALLRWTDADNWYKAQIDGTALSVLSRVAGSTTPLASTPFSAAANTSYSLRFRAVGKTLFAKAWLSVGAEPAAWMLSVTDGTFFNGHVGLRMQTTSGETVTYNSFQAHVVCASDAGM